MVADEVRTLAARRQSSTDENEEMVEHLQLGARAAVKVRNDSHEKARTSVESASSAGAALDSLSSLAAQIQQASS